MGEFDHLIPKKEPGAFDHLIPKRRSPLAPPPGAKSKAVSREAFERKAAKEKADMNWPLTPYEQRRLNEYYQSPEYKEEIARLKSPQYQAGVEAQGKAAQDRYMQRNYGKSVEQMRRDDPTFFPQPGESVVDRINRGLSFGPQQASKVLGGFMQGRDAALASALGFLQGGQAPNPMPKTPSTSPGAFDIDSIVGMLGSLPMQPVGSMAILADGQTSGRDKLGAGLELGVEALPGLGMAVKKALQARKATKAADLSTKAEELRKAEGGLVYGQRTKPADAPNPTPEPKGAPQEAPKPTVRPAYKKVGKVPTERKTAPPAVSAEPSVGAGGKEAAPLLDGLRKLDPEDDRLDPFHEAFDERLAHAAYKHHFGEDPPRMDTGDMRPDAVTQLREELYRNRHDDTFFPPHDPADLAHLARTARRSKSSQSPDKIVYRAYKKPDGSFRVDRRRPAGFFALEGLPEPMQRDLIEYTKMLGDGEEYYVRKSELDRYAASGEKPPRYLKPSEWLDREVFSDDPYAELHRVTIPRKAALDYVKTHLYLVKDYHARQAAQQSGLGEDELEAAIRFYLDEADAGSPHSGGANALPSGLAADSAQRQVNAAAEGVGSALTPETKPPVIFGRRSITKPQPDTAPKEPGWKTELNLLRSQLETGKELNPHTRTRYEALLRYEAEDMGKTAANQPQVATPKPAPAGPAVRAKPTPKPSTPEGTADVTGVAKQVTGREPLKGVSVQEMARRGEERATKQPKAVEAAVEATIRDGKPMDADDLSAVGHNLRTIQNESRRITREIETASDPAILADYNRQHEELQMQAERLLQAADISLNKGFHAQGVAAQIVYKPDYSLATLKARAKGAGLGTFDKLPAHIETKLAEYSKRADDAELALSQARKELETAMKQGRTGGTVMRNRTVAVNTLKKYFGQEKGAITHGGFGKNKQRGAASYTIPSDEMAAMRAVRALAKDIAMKGSGSLDEVLDGIRQEVGAYVPDDTLLRMLSDRYRNHMIESDVAKLRADQYLRDIQRASEARLRPKLKRLSDTVVDIFTATQRSMQAGMDLSAPFIQGRKGLFANPIGWFQSWRPMMEAIKRGDEAALSRYVEIERHPMYARSKAAGLELTVPGGRFTQQEEIFAGNFVRMLEAKLPKALFPAKAYLEGLKRSDAAYSAFLNKLRYDTFVKMAAVDPNNPAYLRDIAQTINTIYGRGSSDLAKAVGKTRFFGNVIYAPRYAISQFEYAGLRPIRSSTTLGGKLQATRVYVAQGIVYAGLIHMARLAGWDVDVDPRSSNFGKVTLPSGAQVDLFAKEGQAYRLVSQMLYGKINQKGKYTEPSGYNAASNAAQFAKNKMSPAARNAWEGAFGTYDDDTGKTRPAEGADYAKSFLPLWVQSAMERDLYKKLPSAAVLNFFGIDAKEGEAIKKSVPLDLKKPGIHGK